MCPNHLVVIILFAFSDPSLYKAHSSFRCVCIVQFSPCLKAPNILLKILCSKTVSRALMVLVLVHDAVPFTTTGLINAYVY